MCYTKADKRRNRIIYSNLVDLDTMDERTFLHDQAICHENCFNLYKLGGFLPPTLIQGFVSDKSQIAKRKDILTLQRDSDLTNNAKTYVYSDAQIAKRFRHAGCSSYDYSSSHSNKGDELADEE